MTQSENDIVLLMWLITPKTKSVRVVDYLKEKVSSYSAPCAPGSVSLQWTVHDVRDSAFDKSMSIVRMLLHRHPAEAEKDPIKEAEESAALTAVRFLQADAHLSRVVHIYMPFPSDWTSSVPVNVTEGHEESAVKAAMTTAITACHERVVSSLSEGSPISYRVQCHPKSMSKTFIDQIPLSIDLHPKKFSHVLTFGYDKAEKTIKCSTAAREYFMDTQVRGEVHAVGNSVSRASLKLVEAMHRLQWAKPEERQVPEMDLATIKHAVDIGAAPGGWTEVLAEKGIQEVLAIDPGLLDARVLEREAVEHWKMRVETAIPTILEQGKTIDMVMCDMNMSPLSAAKLVAEVGPVLADTCWLIFTAKGPLNFQEVADRVTTECIEVFRPLFKQFWVYHLLCNGDERTIVGYRNIK